MNNYNCSTTGINIEAYVQYDIDLSRIYFDDNFEIIKYGNRCNDSELIYTDYGNIKDSYKIEDLFTIENTRANIKGLCYALNSENYFDSNRITREDLSVNFLFHELASWVWSDTEFDKLKKIEILLIDNGVEFESNFIIYGSRGYCQGDYAEVLILTEKLKECWGAFNEGETKKFIDQLLWSVPLSCYVKINDIDFYSKQEGYNKFDKDSLINEILECKDFKDLDQELLKSELENAIPSEPEYI